jgi:hypothetical protein
MQRQEQERRQQEQERRERQEQHESGPIADKLSEHRYFLFLLPHP